jgi:hypothetical protein
MYAQTLGTWSLWQQKFCMLVPNNLGMIIAEFPSNTKICISSVCLAQSATLQSGSQVTPEL